MSSTYDFEPDPFEDEEDRVITCKHCGATDLHWLQVVQPDGRSEKPVLFNQRGMRHICQPSADDFQVIA